MADEPSLGGGTLQERGEAEKPQALKRGGDFPFYLSYICICEKVSHKLNAKRYIFVFFGFGLVGFLSSPICFVFKPSN
ncbi:MAG: hypothetical protein LBI86_06855, partial [Treponema sp.]|nr:hypothetical protein [Treponema sp.]